MTIAPTLSSRDAQFVPTSPQRMSQSIRRHNRAVVLRTLLREKVASRADLARLTGLTRPTISEVVRGLIGDDLVFESGQRHNSRPGKPATLLEFNHEAVRILAIDLSDRAQATAALIGVDGQVIERRSCAGVKTEGEMSEATVTFIQELTATLDHPLLGVGIAVPVDSVAAYDPSRLTASVSSVLDAPVHIAIDADLAANAESRYGATDGEFLLVRLGESTSTAIYTGTPSADDVPPTARELAHMLVDGDAGAVCRCERPGCVHAWISTPLLTARLDAARDADARRQIRAEAGRRLGTSLAVISSALDLPRVVISGPDGVIDDDFAAAAGDAMATVAQTLFQPIPGVVTASTVDDAVLRGAAAHVAASELQRV